MGLFGSGNKGGGNNGGGGGAAAAAGAAAEKASDASKSSMWIGMIIIGVALFGLTLVCGLAALKNVKNKEQAQKNGIFGLGACVFGVIAIGVGMAMKPSGP